MQETVQNAIHDPEHVCGGLAGVALAWFLAGGIVALAVVTALMIT